MKESKNRSYSTRIEKGGKISWPRSLFDWRIGQRVYFSVKDGSVQITSRPSGLHNGRLLLTRIARKFSSKYFNAA